MLVTTRILLLSCIFAFSNLTFAGKSDEYICTFHFSENDENSSNGDLLNLVSIIPEDYAVRVCYFDKQKLFYYVAKSTSKKGNICYYSLDSMFKGKSGQSVKWSLEPPANSSHLTSHNIYMQSVTARSGCPRQDHDSYVLTKNVSIGLFNLIQTSWEVILSSEKKFEEAIVTDSSAGNEGVSEFRSLIFGGVSTKEIKLYRIKLVEEINSNVPIYELGVSISNTFWSIAADVHGDNLIIEKITKLKMN